MSLLSTVMMKKDILRMSLRLDLARIEAHDVLDFRPRVESYNVGSSSILLIRE